MDHKQISNTIATFAAKFCNELDSNKSVVSSPLSAEFVLALIALGSSDQAHDEVLTALGIPNDDTLRASFTSVSSKLKGLQGVTLDVANKVYIKEGPYELNPNLEVDAVKVFNAGIEKANFNNGVAAAKQINSWVESKTNNRIKDLLSSDSFDESTRLVLVNALYFKGDWQSKFNADLTTDMPFYVNASTTINVPMMCKEHDYKYGLSEELGAQFLELPYKGESTSMVIVLPNEIEGLDGVMKKLAGGFDLMSLLENPFKTKVHISIPKFKIETEIDLMEVLPKLGIKNIFDCRSSRIDKMLKNGEQLCVSKAVQKAFIEVNEEGAEAAAATATAMVMLSAMIELPSPHFVVDRPFLAIITVKHTPYFMTVYRGP